MDADIAALIPILEADTEQRLAQLQTDVAGLRKMRAELSAATERTGPDVKLQEDRTVAGPAGPVPVRVFVPHGKVHGVYLHVHGGGWVLGSERGGDPTLRRLASEAGVAVVSVGYRLAPEHPYPAGLDDCMAVARWVESNMASFGIDDERAIAVGGESAGGNLAAALLLRRRDEGEMPFRAAVLTFGVFTAELDLPSMTELWDRKLVLSGPIMQHFVEAYAKGRDLKHPYISPLHADLKGMPPALFLVGTADHLYSDTMQMADAWRRAGGEIELREYAGAPHGFTGMPLECGRAAIGEQAGFLSRSIGKEAMAFAAGPN
ncbi:MAG: alpha/beta hydrolase [bacterium]